MGADTERKSDKERQQPRQQPRQQEIDSAGFSPSSLGAYPVEASTAAGATVSATPFFPTAAGSAAAAAAFAAGVRASESAGRDMGYSCSSPSRGGNDDNGQHHYHHLQQQQVPAYSAAATAAAVMIFSGEEVMLGGGDGGGSCDFLPAQAPAPAAADVGLTVSSPTLRPDCGGGGSGSSGEAGGRVYYSAAGQLMVDEHSSAAAAVAAYTGGMMAKGGGGYAGTSHEEVQQQTLPLSPPLAPLDRNRFKAEAMELESALRSRDGSLHSMASEGDASGRQLASARRLRSLLSSNREDLIREALERDWVPLLMGWLGADTRPAVQVEALWALTNIAAGANDHAQVLTNSGAVPPLVVLLDSPNEEVLEQALWLLGNLAGEGATARDAVLAVDALPPLVRCLERHQTSRSLLKIGSWTLSNLCDGQPRPVLDVHSVIPALSKLLQHTDSEILSHTCWALSHLCDGLSTHIRAVVDANICWRLVDLLKHRSWRVTKPALRTIGNIVCAEDDTDYTQHIIDAGAVPCLQQLIAHSNREIQKEACWTLSNIAAGTVEQIQTVLDSGALPSLVELASSQCLDPADPDSGGADPEVRSEASWAVLNATSCGSDHQIEYLVKEGGIKVLGELLKQSSMVMMALEGLERILQVGDKEAYRLMVGESRDGGQQARQLLGSPPPLEGDAQLDEDGGGGRGGLAKGNPYAALLQATKIELLETHKNSQVAKRAQRIRKRYFVRCAICNQSFSKASLRTHFCPECKCDVCRDCDCTRFHLEFQEELWKEMSEQEANARANKKSKKQKKKQKAKERSKAATTNGTGIVPTPSSSANGTASFAPPPPPPPSEGVGPAPSSRCSCPAANMSSTSRSSSSSASNGGNVVDGDGDVGRSGRGDGSCTSNGIVKSPLAPFGGTSGGGSGGMSATNVIGEGKKNGKRTAGPSAGSCGNGGATNGNGRPEPLQVAPHNHSAEPSRVGGLTERSNGIRNGSGRRTATGVGSKPVCARGDGATAATALARAAAQPTAGKAQPQQAGAPVAALANGELLPPSASLPPRQTAATNVTGSNNGKGKGQRRARATAADKGGERGGDGGIPAVGGSAKAANAASATGRRNPPDGSAGVATTVVDTAAAAANPAAVASGGRSQASTSTAAAPPAAAGVGGGDGGGSGGRKAEHRDANPAGVKIGSSAVGEGGARAGGGAGGARLNGKRESSPSSSSPFSSSSAGANTGVPVGRAAPNGRAATRASGSSSVASRSGGGGGGSGSGGKRAGGGDDDSLRQNDNYVSFLNQTGSILALAQMLDRQSLEEA